MELRGWNELDVILFSGDAYVDHPSFGAAVIGLGPGGRGTAAHFGLQDKVDLTMLTFSKSPEATRFLHP